jgi:polyhydroxyalkanoate synthesis regulator protein
MNKQLDYLKVVILGQLTIEAIENLKGTTKYRQDIKFLGNRFVNMLEDYVNMTMNVFRKITELINKISSADIDELVMIDAVIDKYKENKEWFNEHTSADFLKLD